jgi:hypothetical protein
MKVNLVNYEMAFASGILSKFAWKMSEELDKLGIRNVVTDQPDPAYDVNHHIIYLNYKHVPSINTLMVTHINTQEKLETLKQGMKTADRGICMDEQMLQELIAEGIPQEKLRYVVPAHDNVPLPIPVSILTNVYPDGVKREGMLNELAKHIDPRRFIFRIMGKNWDVEALRAAGLNVEYHPEFNREVQNTILINSKYNLYFGLDKGSMAMFDAQLAGVKTIAPLDGYHRHIGVDFPFTTQEELNAVFAELQKNLLPQFTWENYTKEHLKIWEEVLGRE